MEVGAYRQVFQPGRAKTNPLIFNSVHTNLCHLDGASGLASFTKLVLLSNQHAAPPIVHFRALNPLVTGQRSGTAAAQQMGHTYDSDVNVKDFPALFPKEQVPVPSIGSRLSAPSGVSAFGFGGTMAHVIVDTMAVATSDRVRPPLRRAARAAESEPPPSPYAQRSFSHLFAAASDTFSASPQVHSRRALPLEARVQDCDPRAEFRRDGP